MVAMIDNLADLDRLVGHILWNNLGVINQNKIHLRDGTVYIPFIKDSGILRYVKGSDSPCKLKSMPGIYIWEYDMKNKKTVQHYTFEEIWDRVR